MRSGGEYKTRGARHPPHRPAGRACVLSRFSDLSLWTLVSKCAHEKYRLKATNTHRSASLDLRLEASSTSIECMVRLHGSVPRMATRNHHRHPAISTTTHTPPEPAQAHAHHRTAMSHNPPPPTTTSNHPKPQAADGASARARAPRRQLSRSWAWLCPSAATPRPCTASCTDRCTLWCGRLVVGDVGGGEWARARARARARERARGVEMG